MKSIVRRLFTFLTVASALTLNVATAHEKNVAGPNGGRLITEVEPRAEFFVTAEGKVQITFIGEDGKAVAPAGQIVIVTAGERSAPTRLTFNQVGGVLLSEGTLPKGNSFPAVVQIKATPEAKAVAARFNVNLSICSGCSKPEYACTCGH
jgi:hypothetical protein